MSEQGSLSVSGRSKQGTDGQLPVPIQLQQRLMGSHEKLHFYSEILGQGQLGHAAYQSTDPTKKKKPLFVKLYRHT